MVIVEGQDEVVGIVTDYDTSAYFRRRAEDIMRWRTSRTLKEFILLTFPNAQRNPNDPTLMAAVKQAVAAPKDRGRFQAALKKYLTLAGAPPSWSRGTSMELSRK